MHPLKALAAGLLIFYLGHRNVLAVEQIEAWSYLPTPPFLVDANSNAGLSADLVSYLNQALAGKYQINLVLLPRARMNLMLTNGKRGFVLFAPSAIFGGPTSGTYLWTSPLFADRQEVLSRPRQPFEYRGPDSLAGVRFGAMLGHNYPALARDMDSGKITAFRSTHEAALVNMLSEGHVDVVTIPNSTARYFMAKDPQPVPQWHFSQQNLGEYTRHLMFQQGMEQQRDDFDRVIRQMNRDPAWIATLKSYGLEPIAADEAR